MKQLLTFFAFSFFLISSAYGQYQPMAVEGAHWIYFANYDGEQVNHAFIVQGDTTINGTAYKKMYKRKIFNPASYPADLLPPYIVGEKQLMCALRDDVAAGRVYGISFDPTAWLSIDCGLFQEELLYDLTLGEGDTLIGCLADAPSGAFNHVVDSISVQFLWGQNRKLFYLDDYFLWLTEGIGTFYHPFESPFSFPVPGYLVNLIDYCIGSDEDCGFQDFNSTGEAIFDAHFKVYPNPADGNLFIESIGTQGPIALTLLDLAGQTVWLGNMDTSVEHLSLEGLAAGMYLLVVTCQDGVGVKKVVVR
ncbi:MAG: T9SS type A sorting domain-containing protein [Saprospiraceae bacterium]